MRAALLLFVGAGLLASGLVASSAFDHETGVSRGVTISLVGDASAYLALAATAGGPHACFVTGATATTVSLDFADATGCDANARGTGINAGDGSTKFATYAFHDVLTVTNKGVRTVSVWVNVTSQAAAPDHVDVAKRAGAGQMTMSDYHDASSTALSLSTGSSLYVGVRVNATAASGSVSAQIGVVGRS